MKKILVAVAALLVLVGCGSNGTNGKVKTTVCTLNGEAPQPLQPIETKITHEDDKVKTMSVTMELEASTAEEMKALEEMKDEDLNGLFGVDGIDIKIEKKEDLVAHLILNFDMEKNSKEMMEMFGTNGNEDIKASELIKTITEDNYTCK